MGPFARIALVFVFVILAAPVGAGCAGARAPAGGAAASPGLRGEAGASLESAEIAEIAALEDARALGAGRLQALAAAPAAAIRARALLAFARLQEPSTVPEIVAALGDGQASVRAMAAFAAGELGLRWERLPDEGQAALERALVAGLQTEKDAGVRLACIDALGKVGATAALDALVTALGGEAAEEEAHAAIALALLAKNSDGRVVDARAIEGFVKLLRPAQTASRRYAGAYGLMRYRDERGAAALLEGMSDPDPDVRALCCRALGEIESRAAAGPLARALSDSDERVAAEAARSLAKRAVRIEFAAKSTPCFDALAHDGAKPWRPAVLAAVAAEPMGAFSPGAAKLFATQAASAHGPLQCLAALAHDRALGRIDLLKTCDPEGTPEVRRAVLAVRALGEAKGREGERVRVLSALAQGGEVPVRAAVAQALGHVDAPEARVELRDLVLDPDPAVAAAAAESAQQLKMREAVPALVALLGREGVGSSEAVEAALAALASLGDPTAAPAVRALAKHPSVAVRRAAAQALAALTGEALAVDAAWGPGPYEAEPVPERPVVRLETARGPVRIALDAGAAPRTVRNFLRLVRRGFYDGLLFHRVVPDFVVQGGDPRGDGSGGPGYTLRCEINRRTFEPGSVGMALSGKDTGGSQFFVTLSPQPHLDGRYTNFGEVIEGFDAVRAIEEGDRIVSAAVEAPPPPASEVGQQRRP